MAEQVSQKAWVVAIPSYKRAETLRDKTLRVLTEYNIDPRVIDIFVASEEEKKHYLSVVDTKLFGRIIVGEVGIKNQRNFMALFYPEGQKIFYIDDDISEIQECLGATKAEQKLYRLTNLIDLINEGFELLEKHKYSNWGVYPVQNPFFMKTRETSQFTTTKLCYIIGFMTGVINSHEAEVRTVDDKEDFERSIKYYLKDGGLIRFNNITCKTKCYKEKGGMQIERTKERIHESAVKIVNDYPELAKLNLSKKSKKTEIRLRDTRLQPLQLWNFF